MFKTFKTLEEIIGEVLDDRVIEGEGATTANRFPVRFVLFDNFRDCCDFVEELFVMGNIQIDRLEQWMDEDYPDIMLTHKKLADKIHELILQHPTQYRVIMPFSELARFYNNEPEKAEFNSLINTIKSFDSLSSGYAYKQRVYIPIVGLEGKMQHFRDDAQSFIWYFNNPDRQLDYRLILTDKTTYGVNGLDDTYNVANNVTEWLGFWQYPELKQKILCTSHAIFSHADYAQPDNAFTYCVCHNSYELLTKGLHLDVDCIPYKEEESSYWDTLAKRINVDQFLFEQFFNEQFGIHDLADYKVFFKQWFEHKDNFMRWLLAKYYIYKFCNKGYICQVLNHIDSYSDSIFIRALAIQIFSCEDPEKYLNERAIGLQMAAKNGLELTPEIQKYLVEEIHKIEQRSGVLSAIPYLSAISEEEKEVIIDWYCSGAIDINQLKDLYPDMYYYLQPTVASTTEAWVLDYIDKYKQAKVKNTYTEDIKKLIEDKNRDELAHFKWSNQFSTTKTLLSKRTDIDQYFWIDGLGIDWITFIQALVREREQDGYYLNTALIATAKLPTRTDVNKEDIEFFAGLCLTKIGDLDEVAHTNNASRKYPKFIIDDLAMLRKAINKILDDHPGEKIAIVSDHGMTYLSQLCEGLNLTGYKSDHFGRVAYKSINASVPVKDNHYIVLEDKKTICALRHESLIKKIAKNTGCHGGCTPEEQLVPIFIISPNKTVETWTAVQRTFEISEASPQFSVDILGLDISEIPSLEYDGKRYALTKISGCTYTSSRMALNKDETRVTLHIGLQVKEFTIKLKMAVQEDDLFGDIL